MDKKIKEAILNNTGVAMIMAGSNSDEEHIQKIIKSLEEYSISYQVIICSAHKQTMDLLEKIKKFNQLEKGLLIYIAVAGGTDALSGTLSFYSHAPVISCPPSSDNNSALTNPPGSSNATIFKASNVGKFVAQMFSTVNPKYKKMIDEKNQKKIEKLQISGSEITAKYTKVFYD